ncbi:hypothetical protein BDZ91DRAFT_746696 [Kalaharituber pfeilii]|nr:hypothetical protein BDZ91DRAFT_746696 [Kalaharituber pfeilii]
MAGLLGGKGLRAWRYKIDKADGPECRWCGESEEMTAHLLEEYRVWRRFWPGGGEDIMTPSKGTDKDKDP